MQLNQSPLATTNTIKKTNQRVNDKMSKPDIQRKTKT